MVVVIGIELNCRNQLTMTLVNVLLELVLNKWKNWMSTSTTGVVTTESIVEAKQLTNKKRKATKESESAESCKKARQEASESELSDSRSDTSDISLRDENGNRLIDWGKVQCEKCGKKAHYTSECLLNRLEARERWAHRLERGVHNVHVINPME